MRRIREYTGDTGEMQKYEKVWKILKEEGMFLNSWFTEEDFKEVGLGIDWREPHLLPQFLESRPLALGLPKEHR